MLTVPSKLKSEAPGLNETVIGLMGLGNTVRLSIMKQLLKDEMCVSELASELNLRHSVISQHLTRLRDAGFVSVRREGQNRIYSANPHAIAYFMTRLKMLVQ